MRILQAKPSAGTLPSGSHRTYARAAWRSATAIVGGSAEIGASVAAEAPVEEPVGHEVEQVPVHLIPAPVEFVCDPHEVFDDVAISSRENLMGLSVDTGTSRVSDGTPSRPEPRRPLSGRL